MISIRDIIFDEDEYQDRKQIQYSSNNIKDFDDAIEVIKIPQSEEIKDFQLGKDLKIDLTFSITFQT